jgi:hypothetical protein
MHVNLLVFDGEQRNNVPATPGVLINGVLVLLDDAGNHVWVGVADVCTAHELLAVLDRVLHSEWDLFTVLAVYANDLVVLHLIEVRSDLVCWLAYPDPVGIPGYAQRQAASVGFLGGDIRGCRRQRWCLGG